MINPEAYSGTVSALEHDDIAYPSAILFALTHLADIAAILCGVAFQSILISSKARSRWAAASVIHNPNG